MADGMKVRVVRCPKCDMLLPEPPNSPLYRCGGCNATLQAKKQLFARSDASSENPDSDKVGMHRIIQKRGAVDSKEAWETERERSGVEFRREESTLQERMANSSGHSSSGNKELSYDLKDRYRRPSKVPAEKWEIGSDLRYTPDRLLEKYKEDDRLRKTQMETATGSQRPRYIPEARLSQSTHRAVGQGAAFSPSSDVGSSKYPFDSHPWYRKQVKNQSHPNDFDEFRSLEQDRAEIVRQLDELMERISRSSKASGQSIAPVLPSSRRIVPPNPHYNAQDMWPAESSSAANVGHGVQRSAYLNTDPVLLMNPHDFDMQNFNLPMHSQNEIPGYREMLGPRLHNRAFHPPHHCTQGRLTGYRAGQYMAIDPDNAIPFTQHAFYDQPSCSCVHCYKGQRSGAAHVPPAILHNQRLRNTANNGMFHRLDGHSLAVSGDYDLEGANASLHPHGSESHARVPSVVESEMGGFRRPPASWTVSAKEKPSNHETDMGDFTNSNFQKAVLAKGKVRSCQPLAGGAPFITCCKCLELLRLPKRLLVMKKNQHKLRCGACSNVISYELKGRMLSFSMPSTSKEADRPSPTKNAAADVNNDSINSSCAIQSSVTKPVLSPHSSVGDVTTEMNLSLNLKESEKPGEICSSSSSSDDEESLNRILALIDMPGAPNTPLKVERASSVPGSPLHERFDDSPTNLAVNKLGKGSRSQRSDAEKIFPVKGFSRHNTFKDQSAATETECSYNEYTNSGMSLDSEVVNREEVRPRFGDSFFPGIIKKSFGEFGRPSQSLEDGEYMVSVNGQPIPDHLVKKATRRAGPIRPGNYWYDYRAGFWGVMGFPCLGIIPPYIEEFDYTMPKNCAGGNTGVFVNGRELHQKDLDLLASRGLPTANNKSYVVEITGEVYDEATGEMLESLGKLAPTVIRAKRGFGMKVLRSME